MRLVKINTLSLLCLLLKKFSNATLPIFAIIAIVVGSQIASIQMASATTFSVTNTNTSGPGSFVQALLDSNANPGHDTISFNIPGAGPHVFSNITAQIQITSPLTIDGLSQSGSQCRETLNIVFDYDGTWNASLNFVAGSEGSIIQGLVTNRGSSNFAYYANANNITFRCNYFEMTPDGTAVEDGSTIAAAVPGSGDNTVIGGPTFEDGNVFGRMIDASAGSSEGMLIRNNTFGFSADETQFLRSTWAISNYYNADINDVTLQDNIFQGGYFTGINGLTLKSNIHCLNKELTAIVCTEQNANQRMVLTNSTNIDFGTSDLSDRNYFGNGYECGVYGEGIDDLQMTNNFIGTSDGETFITNGISGFAVCFSGSNIEISYNSVLGNSGSGFSVYHGENISIHNNFIGVSRTQPDSVIGIGYLGISVGNAYGILTLENVDIFENIIGGAVTGVDVNSSSGVLVDFSFTDNTVIDCLAYAIAFFGQSTDSNGGVVSGNTFVGNGGGIWGNGAVQELNIYDNLFDGSDLDKYGIIASNANIYNNVFKNHLNAGVNSDTLSNIYDNEFVDNPYVGVTAQQGASIYGNTFTNTGVRAIHIWNAQNWVNPPVITGVTQDTPDTYSYYVQFDTPIPGDYRFDICSNQSGNTPNEYGDCEEVIYSITVPHPDSGGHSYGIGATGTAPDPRYLSINATLIEPDSSDGYGFSTEFGLPDLPQAELDLSLNEQQVEVVPPGVITNPIISSICNTQELDIESFTLDNQISNIASYSLSINSSLSDAQDNGSFNNSTGTWTGLISSGECLYFNLNGTVTGSIGESIEWDSSISSIVPAGGEEITDIETSASSDYTEIEINYTPDLAVSARLLTTGTITVGSQVSYELTLSNVGLGSLSSDDLGAYFIMPSNAIFSSVTDGNVNDALTIVGCDVIAEDIHDMGPQFSAYHGQLIGCELDSSLAQIPPGASYPLIFNATSGGDFSSGSTEVLGVVFGEDPDTLLFQGAFASAQDGFALCSDGEFPDVGEDCEPLNNIFRLVYDNTELVVTINRCPGFSEVTEINDACFLVNFSKPIIASTFTTDDLVLEGGGSIYSFVQDSDTQWTVRITGMTRGGSLRLLLGANSVQDASAIGNGAFVLGENIIRFGSVDGSASGAAKSANGLLASTGMNGLTFQPVFLVLIGFMLLLFSKVSLKRFRV